MRRYLCPHCSNEVHFDNTACVKCGWSLGYASATDQFSATAFHVPAGRNDGPTMKICANRNLIGCNWLVEEHRTLPFCLSCRHTLIIPDLSTGANIGRWAQLERAKRMLFYALQKFALPLPQQDTAPAQWLRFEFKADLLSFNGERTKVLTGHAAGVVTINIAEADDDVRERHRVSMGEPYRTLIGHFRHEVGHYYWDRLVEDAGRTDSFRHVFGDERVDYARALKRHYDFGVAPGWEQLCVSSYASSHPLEDFAETWAHYFHMVDGLETAQSYGIGTGTMAPGPYACEDFSALVRDWVPLTVAMNAMNRSIGNRDYYPFVLSEAIETKLRFVHELIHSKK